MLPTSAAAPLSRRTTPLEKTVVGWPAWASARPRGVGQLVWSTPQLSQICGRYLIQRWTQSFLSKLQSAACCRRLARGTNPMHRLPPSVLCNICLSTQNIILFILASSSHFQQDSIPDLGYDIVHTGHMHSISRNTVRRPPEATPYTLLHPALGRDLCEQHISRTHSQRHPKFPRKRKVCCDNRNMCRDVVGKIPRWTNCLLGRTFLRESRGAMK